MAKRMKGLAGMTLFCVWRLQLQIYELVTVYIH